MTTRTTFAFLWTPYPSPDHDLCVAVTATEERPRKGGFARLTSVSHYVVDVATTADGTVGLFAKAETFTGPRAEEVYQAAVLADGRKSCTCKRSACSRGQHECRHLQALANLLARGQDPAEVPTSEFPSLEELASIPDPADRRTAFHDAELQVIDRHWADRAAVRRGGVECPF